MRQVWVALILLMVMSLAFKLMIMPDTFPGDGLTYFTYSLEIISGADHTVQLRNIGLPLLASPFIAMFPYHMTLIVFSITISIILIPVSYFFFRKYLEPKYSIVSVFLLNFNFLILQNSVMGITEPLMLVFGVASLTVKNKNLSFLLAGLATIVRIESLAFFVYLAIMYFYQRNPPKAFFKMLLFFILPCAFVYLAFNPFFLAPTIPHMNSGAVVDLSPTASIINFGISFFPFFLMAAVGVIRKPTLLLPMVFFALPGIYAYLIAFDMRFYFMAFPFMALLSGIGIKTTVLWARTLVIHFKRN